MRSWRNLGMWTTNSVTMFHHKVIESTSATLLRLVSSLVSGGEITKPSQTLAQCIQQHVDGTSSNQTTLGLSVKRHHKHGSSELVKTLNKHGITSAYDEVLRFRKSVAKFVSDNQSDYHKKLGLSMEIGPIFSWADNYDLYIASPNGTKATTLWSWGSPSTPPASSRQGTLA